MAHAVPMHIVTPRAYVTRDFLAMALYVKVGLNLLLCC